MLIPELNIQSTFKRLRRPNLRTLIVAVVVVCVIGATVTLCIKASHKQQPQKAAPLSCTQTVDKANDLLMRKKSQEAYGLLIDAAHCGQAQATTATAKGQLLSYSVALANAQLAVGHKEQAYSSATALVQQYDALTAEERAAVPNNRNVVQTLISIQNQQWRDKYRKETLQ
jgi:hypothetical protein